ncbi:MAG: hypothetical protein P8Q55_01615 [Candidatus Poseidoniaceae archaeon]|nr:hypothetical protein [Candidatus Poseidoniaceae archaeon]
MVNLSEFTENLKSDRDTQITVVLIIFFMIAFPAYFNYASNSVSSGGALGSVGDYRVTGEYTFIELDSGEEGIADGDTLTLDLHSDAVKSQIADKNVVAVIVNMTYDEDETETPTIPGGCVGLAGGQDAPDTISATVSRANNTASGTGQNPGGHAVTAEWYDSSIMGSVVSGLSESEIMSMLEGGDAGIGDYVVDISVTAEAGNSPGPSCNRDDGGETVAYTVSLVILDYVITPEVELEV